jgi:peptidoglycan/xylan/chitin deacetylase (PgdA/CDA1 family)
MKRSGGRAYIRLKYRLAWYCGTLVCFFLFITGIIFLYDFLRRKCFKNNIVAALMYHRVSEDGMLPDITVSTKNFRKQVAYLKRNYNVISVDEIIKIYSGEMQVTGDTITITFDDGFKDNYTDALPVLKSYDLPAAVFVALNYLEKDMALNKDEMKEMQSNNITIGAHTITHRVLSEITGEEAHEEIIASKSKLEALLNARVDFFAYPYGKTGRDVTSEHVSMVRQAGFRAAFVTDNGFISEKSDIFALPRIGVRNIPLFVLKARLSGLFENRLTHALRRLAGI